MRFVYVVWKKLLETVAVAVTVTVTASNREALSAKDCRECLDRQQETVRLSLQALPVVTRERRALHCRPVLPSRFPTTLDCPTSPSISATVSGSVQHQAAACTPIRPLFLDPVYPQSWGRHFEPQVQPMGPVATGTWTACPVHPPHHPDLDSNPVLEE